ncbi:MAG: amino acid permease [Planctomycetales bacterium]|nr:amino acid permease [Planctomycetales bacterium]
MSSSTPSQPSHAPALERALGPVMLWGLGVGYVISGEYFGWNLGLITGGTYGLLAAFVLITVMYVTFVLSYTEMACAIPRAGGVFVYGVRGLGLAAGYLGGIAQVVEFVFAPPAIAFAIGAYAQFWLPVELRESLVSQLDPWGLDARHAVAVVAYALFTALNIWGVRQAAMFELAVTVLAVGELLLFTGVAAPQFRWSNFTANAVPNGWWGVLPAIPIAIWFYLAIEGAANAA